jgi:hypothetical protein
MVSSNLTQPKYFEFYNVFNVICFIEILQPILRFFNKTVHFYNQGVQLIKEEEKMEPFFSKS